ncbi:MAG: hypothetical protein Q4Q18_01640 [Methanobrevibacter sp.]|nr:hypothetical protein [Methanobrevibacter sp.]
MNMKNTVILLIFLLAVLGLIIGVHYSEDADMPDTQDNDLNSIDEDIDSDMTITLNENQNNELIEFFT